MFPITSIFPSSFMYYVITFTSSPLPLPYLSPSSPLPFPPVTMVCGRPLISKVQDTQQCTKTDFIEPTIWYFLKEHMRAP